MEMVEEKTRSKGLGRGLSALMGSTEKSYEAVEAGLSGEDRNRPGRTLPIEFLFPNPYQPRTYFNEDKSRELIESIRQKGVLQPLLVRPRDGVNEYEIIAGERRWRASQAAGLHEVPVVIREMTDVEALEIALIENIQRHDLSPVEEAAGYRRLMDEFGHTQEKLGSIVGKSRSHIANILRLLALPQSVQDLVAEGKLSMGHARALITAENPEELARKIIAEGLSVRRTELLAKGGTPKLPSAKPAAARMAKDADTVALEHDLSQSIGLKVTLDLKSGESGELRISYNNLDQLDDICRRLSL